MTVTPDQCIEFFSAFACVLSIWLNVKRNVLGWPIGIASVVLASWVYWQSHLYAELVLQLFFFLSGFWGWWQWSTKKNEDGRVEIDSVTKKEIAIGIGFSVLFSGWIYLVLSKIPGSTFPFPDACITSFSLLGQYWLSKRWIENWLVWMAVNLASVTVYFQKELWFFTALYSVLFFLAVRGYFLWKSRKLTYA